MVQVVSMLDVMIRLGETVFQSSEVSGAVWSGVLELESRARGVSLAMGTSRGPRPVMELLCDEGVSDGSDHSRRWSPDVASRSVDCFWDDGGSQRRRVTGYECVASAILVKSMFHLEVPGASTSGGVGFISVSRICICVVSVVSYVSHVKHSRPILWWAR